MTKFIQRGDSYRLTGDANLVVQNTLPVGTYTVDYDAFASEYFLKTIASYDIKTKMYGDVISRATRIMQTYKARAGSTGVLLSGEKGTGKTLLAKSLSQLAAKDGYPTIVINNNYHGEAFNRFIQSVDQPCVILFDEFEKIYHEQTEQEAMLTLLDGVYPTHKLFVLTTNDRYGISRHMLNRPGRLFYHIEYRGLEESFIREYCLDMLKDQTQTEGVVRISTFFEAFNFDMLQSLVEEMNRYNESATVAMTLMNIKMEGGQMSFDVDIQRNGTVMFPTVESPFRVDPMKPFSVYYYETEAAMKKGNDVACSFGPDSLVSIQRGVYRYELKTGVVLTLTRKPPVSYSHLFAV